jgi:hypothetical protein
MNTPGTTDATVNSSHIGRDVHVGVVVKDIGRAAPVIWEWGKLRGFVGGEAIVEFDANARGRINRAIERVVGRENAPRMPRMHTAALSLVSLTYVTQAEQGGAR